MATLIRHSAAQKPLAYPYNGADDLENLDRVQSLTVSGSVATEPIYENGRLVKAGTDVAIPESKASITQLEYGTMDTYLVLANKTALPSGGLQLSDYSDAKVDIVQEGKTQFGGALEQTVVLQKMAVDSIGVSIADPEAKIERSFELSGDNYRILREGNKYFIRKTDEAPTGTSGAYNIVLSDPAPVANPIDSTYFLKVLRIRSGVTTELELTTDYTYVHGTTTLTIAAALAGDFFKIDYSAASFGTAGDPAELNDIDGVFLKAGYVTVTLDDGTTEVELDRLTSLDIKAALNRLSESVIGSCEKLINEVKDYTVNVSLNGRVKNSTLAEILMGEAGNNFGIIDIAEFVTNLTLRVKIYDSCAKTNFLIGFKVTGLTFENTSQAAPVNDFLTEDVALVSDNLLISDQVADINA